MVSQVEKVQEELPNRQKQASHQQGINLAASWYVAMRSNKLRKKPKAIELFSQPLVAWRNQQGHPVIMERFCAHMGASLALGKLKDGCLQCPFHHWQFNSTGECISIPEIDKIPATARQKTYVTIERYGFIWVWYGTETPLFPLPEFPPAESEQKKYMPLRIAFNLDSTVCRVLENPYDPIHLLTLHKLNVAEPMQVTLLAPENRVQHDYEDAWLGALVEARLAGYVERIDFILEALGLKFEKFRMQVESWPSGHVTSIFLDHQEAFQAMMAITPIADNKLIVQLVFTVKKTTNLWLNLLYYLFFGVSSAFGSTEDVPIWNTLKPDGGGAYVKTDRELLKFRDFYHYWVNQVQ